MAVRGGHRLRAHIAKALAAQGVQNVRVGFFETARYPDGTPVAAVAAWQEFGTQNADGSQQIPERPAFRNSLRKGRDDVQRLIRERIDSTEMVVGENLAHELGELVKGQLQTEIVELRRPPNAPATILRKGSSNPLVDTGKMLRSVTHRART